MFNVSITKLIFIETDEQTPQYYRPFDTHVDYNIQNEFNSLLSDRKELTAARLSTIGTNIIKPQTQHTGLVAIPGGWNQKKLRFFMEVDSNVDYAGSKRSQIITGFTDYCDVSFGGCINPNTKMYFNNNISILESAVYYNNQQATRRAIENVKHILHADPTFTVTGNKAASMRPEDAFSIMSSGALSESTTVVDCNTAFVNGMQTATRRDSFSPSYLEKVYNSYNAAISTNNSFTSEDSYSKARDYCRPTSDSFDNFIRLLKNNTSMNYGDFLTYGELCGEFKGLDTIVKVIRKGNNVSTLSNYNANSVSHMAGANYETIDSNYLFNSLPALMMDLMLSDINFAITNDTLNGLPVTTVQSFNGFSNKINMSEYISSFKFRFEHEYFPYISKNGLRKVKLLVHMDIVGESYIKVQYDDNHSYEFLSSTFCDGFFSPLITNEPIRLQRLAGDLNTLLSNTDTIYGVETSNYQTNFDNSVMFQNNASSI